MRVGDIIGVIVVAILLVVSAIILGQFQSSISSLNLTNETQAAISNIFSNVWLAIQLLTIGIFIGAAVAIVVAVIGGLGVVTQSTTSTS